MTTRSRTSRRKPLLVIGNWKMNPQSVPSAVKLFTETIKATPTKRISAESSIAAPFVFIGELSRIKKKGRFMLASQDVSSELQGAHTGDVSLSMLKSLGVSQVIIGHSERRAMGETDEQVRTKAEIVLKGGLTAVVCVGERVRDKQGDYFGFVQGQVKSLLHMMPKTRLKQLVIAYEPIWAIGTGMHATPEDVHEMKLFIQKCITEECSRSVVSHVRILYGGSVDKNNAEVLLRDGHADGFLVGGASLHAAEFGRIIEISDLYGKE